MTNKKKASQLGKAVKPTRKKIQSHYTTNEAGIKEQIIFCLDQTCKYNHNAVCKKRELHHKVEQGNLEQGQAKVSVVCEDYEVKKNA